MEKMIFLPNFRNGFQISPKVLEKTFGGETHTFLLMYFENFFVMAKFNETKALADQTRAFSERFKDEKLCLFQIETLHSAQFTMSQAQLAKNLAFKDSADVFIVFVGTLYNEEVELPYLAVQPANCEQLVCDALR